MGIGSPLFRLYWDGHESSGRNPTEGAPTTVNTWKQGCPYFRADGEELRFDYLEMVSGG